MREIVCPCGHMMTAADEAELYQVVRGHVDDEHPDKNLSRTDIETMIAEESYDAE